MTTAFCAPPVLTGKVALVAGGSRGIGAVTARALARVGQPSRTGRHQRRWPTFSPRSSTEPSPATSAAPLGMRHQIPAMLRHGGGSIVNMASTAGLQGVAGLAGYVTGADAGIIA